MRIKLLLFGMMLAVSWLRAENVRIWDGRERGMDLVTIGHKRVTVFLSDGRTAVIGVPILIERTNVYRMKLLEAGRNARDGESPGNPGTNSVQRLPTKEK